MLQDVLFLATPFKFNSSLNRTALNTSSVKKPVFDLKASLSRPINYKPYTGKLKPLNLTGAYSQPISAKQATTGLRAATKKYVQTAADECKRLFLVARYSVYVQF